MPHEVSIATRHVMQANRSKNTSPELLVRQKLREEGLPGYRLHWKKAAGKPDVPTLLFVSDGSQVRAKDWARLQHEYVAGLSNSRVIELGCGHYVHNFEQERIAAEMRAFVGAVGR